MMRYTQHGWLIRYEPDARRAYINARREAARGEPTLTYPLLHPQLAYMVYDTTTLGCNFMIHPRPPKLGFPDFL